MSIEKRKFSFCPTVSGLDIDNLIVECPKCTRFFAACCPHKSFGGDMFDPEKKLCHHYQIVFTDGACSHNGQGDEAKAGLGIVMSDSDDDLFWSIPVDDTVDTAPRTSQRAELLAAIEGLKNLREVHQDCTDHKENLKKSAARRRVTYIVVTDSEYVVKGITEWFPAWRVSGHSG